MIGRKWESQTCIRSKLSLKEKKPHQKSKTHLGRKSTEQSPEWFVSRVREDGEELHGQGETLTAIVRQGTCVTKTLETWSSLLCNWLLQMLFSLCFLLLRLSQCGKKNDTRLMSRVVTSNSSTACLFVYTASKVCQLQSHLVPRINKNTLER